MTQKTRDQLKALFQTNDTPTGADFGDLIDSCINQVDTTAQTINSDLVITGTLNVDTLQANDVTVNLVQTSSLVVTGSAAYFGTFNNSSDASAVAAGTNQATATQITRSYNRFVTVATGQGAILPTMSSVFQGPEVFVFNDTIVNLNIYPRSSGNINSLATNAPYVVSASARVSFYGFQLNSYFTK